MPVVPFATPESHRSRGSGAEWRKGWDCGKVWPRKVFGRTSKSCRGYSTAEGSRETRRNSRLTLSFHMHRHTDTQTQTQTHRHTQTQTHTHTDTDTHTQTHTHRHTVMEKQDRRWSAGYEPRTTFDISYLGYLSDSLCSTSFDVSGNCSSEKLGHVPTVTQPVND